MSSRANLSNHYVIPFFIPDNFPCLEVFSAWNNYSYFSFLLISVRMLVFSPSLYIKFIWIFKFKVCFCRQNIDRCCFSGKYIYILYLTIKYAYPWVVGFLRVSISLLSCTSHFLFKISKKMKKNKYPQPSS